MPTTVIDFPSDVPNLTPTFLVGGDENAHVPARTPISVTGQAIIAGTAPEAILALNLGVPEAVTSRVLTNADDGKTLVCTVPTVLTVNTGLIAGFGCAIKGPVTFDGTATVEETRRFGTLVAWCALVAVGTDSYDVVGSAL